MGKLDGEKILEYLKRYNSQKLYAKVGFMLELLNDGFGVDEKVIEECRKNINERTYYFDNETKRSKNKYVGKWNLVVPEIFLNRGRTLHWQVREYLKDILIVDDNTKEFYDKFQKGIYEPELLFDNEEIIERIKEHPMIIWKLKRLLKMLLGYQRQ